MKRAIGAIALVIVIASCGKNLNKGDATGTFGASEVIVSTEVPGRIMEFNVSEGDLIRQGQEVGYIDSTHIFLQKQQLLKNIEALESNRPDVEAQLAPYREQLENSRRERTRIGNLLDADAATEKQLDDIVSAIAVAEKHLSAQEQTLNNSIAGIDAQIEGLNIQAQLLDDQLVKARIVSPIDGTVLAKYAQAGELASPGRPLMKVADMDDVYLKAYLTSEQLAGVKLGQQVKVFADFGGGNTRDYEGTVTWISDKSEFTPKNILTSSGRANMVYAVKISVENDGNIKLGMYGQVKF